MKVLKATWQIMGAADCGGVQERNMPFEEIANVCGIRGMYLPSKTIGKGFVY